MLVRLDGNRVKTFLRDNLAYLLCFLVIALMQGAYYIHYIGALTFPDTELHARGCYALATGQAFNPVEDSTDGFGNQKKGQLLSGDSRFLLLEGRSEMVISAIIDGAFPTDPYKELQVQGCNEPYSYIELSPAAQGGVYTNRSNQYFPLAWLPQAVGMKMGMLLGFSPYSVWQAGRIASLIIYIALIAASIALVPKMKALLVILGIIPTTLFCASSLMPDATIVGICTLSVALTLRWRKGEGQLGFLRTFILASLAAVVALMKPAYFPICMGFIVLPSKRMSNKEKIAALAVVIAACLAYLVWSHYLGDVAYIVNIDSNQDYLFNNILAVILRIMYAIVNLPQLLFGMSAMYLAIAMAVTVAVIAPMAHWGLGTPSGAVQAISNGRYVIGGGAAALLSLGITLFFLLLTWNDLSSQATICSIGGFQGRYLLPIYPLLAYIQTLYMKSGLEYD